VGWLAKIFADKRAGVHYRHVLGGAGESAKRGCRVYEMANRRCRKIGPARLPSTNFTVLGSAQCQASRRQTVRRCSHHRRLVFQRGIYENHRYFTRNNQHGSHRHRLGCADVGCGSVKGGIMVYGDGKLALLGHIEMGKRFGTVSTYIELYGKRNPAIHAIWHSNEIQRSKHFASGAEYLKWAKGNYRNPILYRKFKGVLDER